MARESALLGNYRGAEAYLDSLVETVQKYQHIVFPDINTLTSGLLGIYKRWRTMPILETVGEACSAS